MMLTNLFTSVLNMSLTGSVVILAVYLVRLVLRKAPKIYSYVLWSVVLFRLLCPVSITAPFSLIPDRVGTGEIVAGWEDDYIGETHTIFDNRDEFYDAVNAGRDVFPAGEGHYYVVTGGDGISEPQTVKNTWMPWLAIIWLSGVGGMLVYSILSYIRIRKQTRVSVPFRKGVYIADDVDTPFVMGLFRPIIYLPGKLDNAERRYIIAHERHHIRRGDHFFKALAFFALTIHWFNPLAWLAFVLASRDMEMSCDEAVIRRLGEDVRADYATTLLNMATGKRLFTGTPLAFGEGNPTGRVRNLANWKKPAVWVVILCIIVCIVAAVCLLTDPEDEFDWSVTRQEGPTGCALGDFNYSTPDGLAIQGIEIDHDGNAWDYGSEFYVGDTVVGGVALRYQDRENGLVPFTREWELALGIPEALEENMAYFGGSSSYADYEITYFPDIPVNYDDVGQIIPDENGRKVVENEVTHYFFLNGDDVYDLWLYDNRLSEKMQKELLQSAYIQPPTEVSDFGVALFPERVTRTGATATFVFPSSFPIEGELTYGDFLSLDRLVDGNWVPCDELAGYDYFVGDSSYPVTDGYGMVHEWPDRFGELPDGTYRMGKLVTRHNADGTTEEQMVYGHFTLPNSIQTEPIPLEDLPEKYSGEQAMIDGCFVQTDGIARENQDLFHQFAETTYKGEPAFIRIVDWHYGDNSFCVVTDLAYDGSAYTATWLEDGQRQSREYRYLKHFAGPKEQGNMAYDAYEHYVLVNDENVTWVDIWNRLKSANHESAINYSALDHMTVYSNYTYQPKTPQIPANLDQAVLEFDGEVLVSTTDFDRLEKLYLLFTEAEFLGYEPKTHSIGLGLNLVLTTKDGKTVTIELDPDNDICRIDGEYVFYGAPDEPSYIEKLWYYLDIPAWPDVVYEQYPNALRP